MRVRTEGRSPGRVAGFSLLEMGAAVAISALVLTWSLTGVSRVIPRWRLERAAADVASSLRAARATAILDGAERSMGFDPANGRYVPVEAPIGSEVKTVKVDDKLVRVSTLDKGVRFVRPDPITGDDRVVTFSPVGALAAGESDAVFNSRGLLNSSRRPAFVYLGNGDLEIYRRVRVNLIGSVTVERWTGSSWKS